MHNGNLEELKTKEANAFLRERFLYLVSSNFGKKK